MNGYEWWTTGDVEDFLSRAGDFLRSRPAAHTVALSVTEVLRTRGPRAFGDAAPEFGVLAKGTDVRGVFLRTPPHRLNLTALDEDEAEELADALAGRSLNGVQGDRDTAEVFARAWSRRTGDTAELHQRQRLYRLAELQIPAPAPPGRARCATEADRPLLRRWLREFMAAVGERTPGDPDTWIDGRLAYGGVTLWEDADGTPVAMAGVTPRVAGQVRVAPVYTPADLRGRGYAGAVTAEVSRVAQAEGAEEVLLFTDLANPTSNGLYQRIGYRPVRDFAVYDFAG